MSISQVFLNVFAVDLLTYIIMGYHYVSTLHPFIQKAAVPTLLVPLY